MGKNENLSTKENEVILKKEPTAIAMRIFNWNKGIKPSFV